MLVERFFTRPSKPVMPQVLSETFKPNPPAFTRPLRWLVACMLCVGMLPMQANGADTLLAFAPYAFATERHGTINAQVAFLEVPRRHDEPDGPRMRLRVVRLPASGGNGKATPVVYCQPPVKLIQP
ncbi:hypothetical protein [Xanthomonas campestris]|uniref:hypothetical protein n=2 Tax=Xanthomonas campestris TaxID=339 RepID=UPI002B233F54|nr:hypothetical protein [Xanthomonas campestris]MEA9573083.1 hypothetical protein [Xanthomonas campestris]